MISYQQSNISSYNKSWGCTGLFIGSLLKNQPHTIAKKYVSGKDSIYDVLLTINQRLYRNLYNNIPYTNNQPQQIFLKLMNHIFQGKVAVKDSSWKDLY